MRGDEGARTLLVAHPVVEVPCDGTGEATDVDTPADLAALEGGSAVRRPGKGSRR